MKGPLLGDFVNITRWIIVIDQDQVPLALLLVVEELALIAQVIDEFPVAVNPQSEHVGFWLYWILIPNSQFLIPNS